MSRRFAVRAAIPVRGVVHVDGSGQVVRQVQLFDAGTPEGAAADACHAVDTKVCRYRHFCLAAAGISGDYGRQGIRIGSILEIAAYLICQAGGCIRRKGLDADGQHQRQGEKQRQTLGQRGERQLCRQGETHGNSSFGTVELVFGIGCGMKTLCPFAAGPARAKAENPTFTLLYHNIA